MTDIVQRLRAATMEYAWAEDIVLPWRVKVIPPTALALEAAAEIERLRKLVSGRDDFIVEAGLWQKFTEQLPMPGNKP